MGKFDGVLLASDFDNTLIYTGEALRTGKPVPPLSERNRAALERFISVLEEAGIPATVRRTLGADISASCGQLRQKRL